MENKLLSALNQLENIRTKLSESFNINFDYLKQYLATDKPVVYALATNTKVLKDFNDALNIDGLIINNFNTEEISFETSESFIKDIVQKISFSDCIVILTTALRIAPSGIYSIVEKIKKLNKKTFIFISELQHLPQKDDIIARKISESAQTFDLIDAECFACSKEGKMVTKNTKTFFDAINIMKQSIQNSFAKLRDEQTNTLIRELYKSAIKEAISIKDTYIKLKSLLNEERQIAHSTIESINITSKSIITAEFSLLKDNIYSCIKEISWNEIKTEIISQKGFLPKEDEFFELLQNTIKKKVEDSIKGIKQFSKNQLSTKLDNVIQNSKISLERNLYALSKIEDIDTNLLDQMKTSINDDDVFSDVRQRCIGFEKNYIQWFQEESSRIIASKIDDIKLKILDIIRTNKTKKTENSDSQREEKINYNDKAINDDKDKMINRIVKEAKYIGSKYQIMIDQAFDLYMNDLINSINNDLINSVDAKVDKDKIIVSNMLKEATEKYCQKFVSFYSKFVSANETKFYDINKFIEERIF